MPNVVELEQPRAFRHQQPQPPLHRRDVLDEVERVDGVEQVDEPGRAWSTA